jgi:uncharacterized membrane protein YgcG
MKRLFILLAVSAALLAPSAAFASGVVLKVQQATHLVAVTNGKTNVNLVHTAAKLQVGQLIALKGRTLRNGTLAASSVRVLGRAHTVHFRALLLKKSRARMVLSAGGAIISVKRRAARTTSSANATGPVPGSIVDVTATVGPNSQLAADAVNTVSASAPGGAIEGQLTIGTGTITVASDQMALVLTAPTTVDLANFANGDEVLANFTQGADGTLTLTSLFANDNAQGANGDDDGNGNGDNGGNGNSSGGGDNGGSGGGGDGGGNG